MVASCVLMLIGLVLLLAGFPLLALTILIYGGGYGIMWIARGTLPLALFGPDRYATLMGRLAFPSLIVQALAPSATALLIEQSGVDVTMATLTAFAALNVVPDLLCCGACAAAQFAVDSPALLATLAHFSTSFLNRADHCSGELPTGTAPSRVMRACTSGVFSMATISPLSLSMMSFGVPAGANTPCHELIS